MNILITRHDKIGDFITSLPLYYVIKQANPDATIYALVSEINMELAKQIDFIDEVILYDKKNFRHMLKSIKAANITTSISAFIDTRLGWLLFLSGIKTRIAPATKLAQIFFNKTLRQRRSLVEKTEIKYNLDLAKVLNNNIDLTYQTPLLNLDNKQEFRSDNHLKDKKLILLHPGYGGSSDGNLTLEDYVELSDSIRKQKNIQIIWIFGPDDLSTKDKIKISIPDSDFVYQPATVLDYCYLIRDSELLISTSTGPMHLAGALNIKTVSFFGSSLFASPKRWKAVNDLSKQHNFIINKNFRLVNIENAVIESLC
ncbi:glycosyltransferase family 9 protein [Candidatus Thioglobus sp.]|nr:glycosyltransferase family 9 protein [Candidatus Thioglobus sp.]